MKRHPRVWLAAIYHRPYTMVSGQVIL